MDKKERDNKRAIETERYRIERDNIYLYLTAVCGKTVIKTHRDRNIVKDRKR